MGGDAGEGECCQFIYVVHYIIELLLRETIMIKTIIAGAGGRMGGRIVQLINETQGMTVAGAFEKSDHPAVNKDLGEYLGAGRSGLLIASNLGEVIDQGDVIIDFTFHSASMENVRLTALKQKPIVIGSTGFSPEELAEIKNLSQSLPVVLAPNMSVGVNVLFKVV
ncbi:MAG: hypothetical protein C0407_14015, partial [Desulfobacca sp.]|nr:hypothetical protein [Desulfobacca sp.]